jgi:hypothetical protein
VGEGVGFACDVCPGEGLGDVGEGFAYFAGSAAGGAVFGYCSRSLFSIFEESGDVGILAVVFAGAGGGFWDVVVGGDPVGLYAAFGGAAVLAMGLDVGFSTTAGFADVDALAVGVFGPAFVDFARVVVFFVASGISTSTGSEMTFLGLPLFFTASEDMLAVELGWEE